MDNLDLLNYKEARNVIREQQEYGHFCTKRNLDKALNNLVGIIDGIEADHRIDIKEQQEIANWIEVQDELRNRHPFDEIIEMLHTALEDGILSQDELDDIKWVCERHIKNDGKYDLKTHALQHLHGLLHGISANNVILVSEVTSLKDWLINNGDLAGAYPFDEVNSIVAEVLRDGVITEDEHNLLRAYFGEFIDMSVSLNISEQELNEIRKQHSVKGICALCPQIEIEGHLFCFTGKSSKTNRKEIAKAIEGKGGLFHQEIVAQTQYLVVGNENSSCWAYSCYGRKVERAMEMRKNGASITIVHENDFWDAVQD